LFLWRLWLPVIVFAGFSLLSVSVYMHLEHLPWQDALFWMIHPHAIEYTRVRDTTRFFAIFVYLGAYAFQVCIAERILVTIFNRQGMEAWRAMANDVALKK